MKIDVLGSLSVTESEFSIVPTASQQRTVLAMLAVSANKFVSASCLQRELWPDTRPMTARTAIQSYVLSLRKQITKALGRKSNGSDMSCCQQPARDVLVTRPDGYLLRTRREDVVAEHFEQLSAFGHRAREQGDFEAASLHFSKALKLWRGSPLEDVHAGPLLRIERERLREAHLNVLDRRIEADLRLGRHHELLGELRSVCAQHPTHEGLCTHFMLALYRSGRRAEALEVFHRMRTSLVRELGLEPSPALQRLQQSMLVSDQGLNELTVTWDVTPC